MEYHKKYKAEGKEHHEVVTLMMNGRCWLKTGQFQHMWPTFVKNKKLK